MLHNNESFTLDIKNEFSENIKDDEPGVINYACLVNLASQQAPPGEAGRLYREDGIKLNEIEEIRIEFLRILKIDHLWIMTNLVKLTLAHNTIEKIEKLDALIKLRELDISFNSIRIMENLNCLTNLEILLLAGNLITTIEGMDYLKNLTIFSIADNRINEWEHILYLRKLKNLRSVNIAGNLCTLQENYYEYFVAFLPQVIYFSYAMIQEEDRANAVKIYWRSIAKVEDNEAKAQTALEEERARNEKIAIDSAAFVDQLDGDEFFQLLFVDDKRGTVLKNINGDTFAVFEKCKVNFSDISREFHQFGIEHHSQRTEETEIFSTVVKEARDVVRDEARKTIDSMQNEKDEMFTKFNIEMNEFNKKLDEEMTTNDQTNLQINAKLKKIQTFTEEFNQFSSTLWTKLVYSEVVLHEQIEDINETFKSNIADMKDAFVESVRVFFSRMRNVMIEYREAMDQIVSNYLNNIVKDELTMPSHLADICGDTSMLNNTLALSHDIHLQTIDNREDDTINKINKWFDDLMDQLSKEETTRHRRRILEISHIMQYHRESLHAHILATDDLAVDVVAALEG